MCDSITTPEIHPDEGVLKKADSGAQEWQKTIRENLDLWLNEVTNLEDIEPADDEPPDLESFFSQLCILSAEFRKASRRSHDTFVQMGETLAEFDGALKRISAKLSEFEKEKQAEDILSKKRIYLPLVEMFQRFKRIQERLNRPPRSRFLFLATSWQKAWKELREGFNILCAHFEALLGSEGITPVEALGKAFDSTLMTAVEAEETDSAPPGTVIEEFSTGFLYKGYPLKLAKVKVAKGKGV
ncbi:MAG: nucleotide exchange factor GrpE [Deltaproteobacteria bacterium]|nr:nucleotide exchange factor GrpE [Deltaproteobacteria bacterium]MBW2300442.1 nucleotide exchange factor GrpE [Deltaproteobacteria bacterium]